MALYRIHNSNFDITVEAEDLQEASVKFADEHPDKFLQTVNIQRVDHPITEESLIKALDEVIDEGRQ